jgi:hypothetical protein
MLVLLVDRIVGLARRAGATLQRYGKHHSATHLSAT